MDNAHNLDLGDPIFDSLKEDYYPEFEDWFKKIQTQGRECLVYRNNDESLGALLIYKDENEPIYLLDEALPEKERMKIATLIVSSTGYKIGEFFIQWATNYAISKGFEEIYLTHFTAPDDYLVYLIEEYGFIYVGQKNYKNQKGDYEDVFIKYLRPTPSLIKKIENKKLFLLLAAILSLSFVLSPDMFSQGPPPWAPAHGYRAKTRHIIFSRL